MRYPRFPISCLMAIVLLVALDFGAIRALLLRYALGAQLSELIAFGAVPMANILAIGLIASLCYRPARGRSTSALIGFQACGWLALLAFLVVAFAATGSIHAGLGYWIGARWGLLVGPAFLSWVASILVAPQLFLALLGSLLSWYWRVGLKAGGQRSVADPTATTRSIPAS